MPTSGRTIGGHPISAVNGCPSCIASHERALTSLSVDAEKIHDAVRIASVIKGLHSLSASVEIFGQ